MKDTTGRRKLLDFLNRELIGPVDGKDEIISDTVPLQRYTMGILFPVASSADDRLETEEEEPGGDENTEDPVTLAGQWMPSSIGLTFYLSGGDRLGVEICGAKYDKENEGSEAWKRFPVAESDDPEVHCFAIPGLPNGKSQRDSKNVLDGRGQIQVHWRRMNDGYLTTVTLLNVRDAGDERPAVEDCLYQVGMTCRAIGGRIHEYPDAKNVSLTDEEEEMRVLYRDAPAYAIGHGCAASWTTSDETVTSVATTLIPEYELPPITHTKTGDTNTLRIARLADPNEDVQSLLEDLKVFVEGYEVWTESLPELNPDIPLTYSGAKNRLLDGLRETASRMRRGIDRLHADADVLRAFRLANRAMLMQMYHGKAYGKRRSRNSVNPDTPDYLSLSEYTWRPFQLAYQLLTLDSAVDESSQYRGVVDLIWFPTGGGKTEAYLAVAATQIFLRRIRHGDQGGGTTVITRYTLRLLTAQQFERSARLICACETIRREHTTDLGSEPISIGLWAGGNMSPNYLTRSSRYSKSAKEAYEDMLEDESPSNPFQLDQCPWCGTEIIPERRDSDPKAYGVEVANRSFSMYCPTDCCHFHEQLPVSVVDEDLYQRPPTFLIATVDKFAQLVWNGEAGVFFGGDGSMGPSLILQDELHLLSGPLGTTTGIYESGIEALMEMKGVRPKIIASTATIRNAGDQVRGLFGNEVRLFPPPGLSASDSYFAETDQDAPGRLYAGILSSNHRATTSLIRTSAALQQAMIECDLTEKERDAYWTLVVYHNSLRELGKTVTFARDDIPARIRVIARDQSKLRKLQDLDVVELTSNLSDEQIPAIFNRLTLGPDDDGAISMVACTNMFSVGVDIQRLGLMLVNGQPKTTSEYIQASSRVGRGQVPGLVVAHYASSKPRDRSHYESFLPYHSALYKNVEPTSVTPFSLPSRDRALHAAFVILIRHGAGLKSNESAGSFDRDDPDVKNAAKLLLRAASRMEPAEAQATERHLATLIDEWHERAKLADGALYYRSNSRSVKALLKNFGASGDGWETLNSMRNVDRQCEIAVIGEHDRTRV